MPVDGDPVGGGVPAKDDGRGTLLLGAAERIGAVQGLRGGDGGWIIGRTHDNTTWASGRGDMELENLGHGERAADVPHGLLGKGVPRSCPVEGCPEKKGNRTAMQVHFLHWHVLDTVVILEEGNLPHPQFPQCKILVPWCIMNGRHPATSHCTRGEEQKRRRLLEEELR